MVKTIIVKTSIYFIPLAKLAKTRDSNSRIVSTGKMRYKGRVFTINSVKETDIPIESIQQKNTESAIYFLGQLSPLSNLYKCTLDIDGVIYNSSEQYYQAEKARAHGDIASYSRIMMESDPAEIKRLDKSISRNPAITSSNDKQHGLQIMERALISKFSNPRLRSFLLATRKKKIIEASYDKSKWFY